MEMLYKWAFLLLFFTPSATAHAQSIPDYVITINNDTIRGPVKRINLNSKFVRVYINGVWKKLHFKDLKGWVSGRHTIVILPDSSGKKLVYHELRLMDSGSLSLYLDEFFAPEAVYYIGYEGRIIFASLTNIKNFFWPQLSQCPAFKKLYQDVFANNGSQPGSIRWEALLRDMVRYYNNNCYHNTRLLLLQNQRCIYCLRFPSLFSECPYYRRCG